MAEGSGIKVNMLFHKVLGENEKCVFHFCLKTEGTFWPTQYMKRILIGKQEIKWSLSTDGTKVYEEN